VEFVICVIVYVSLFCMSYRNQALDQHLRQQQLQRSNQWHSIPVQLQPEAAPQQQLPQPQQQQGLENQQLPAGSSPTQARQQLPDKPQIQPQQQPQQQPQDQAATADAAVNDTARPATPTGTSSISRGSSAQASPQQRQAVSAAAQAAAQQLAARLASSLKAPKTGHEFESAWRSLKGDVQLQVSFFCVATACMLHV
jgi:hypothetical protein